MPPSGLPSKALAIFALALVSFAVAIGRTLDLHNADSLIPTLVSLDYWLPFYWGQDRFGMLVPLLASPVRDSFWNLIAQNALSVFLLLAGTYAAAARCEVSRPEIVPLVLLSLVLAWPVETTALQILTTNQSYSPALGLFGLGFAISPPAGGSTGPGAHRGRHAAAVLLIALGAWTNAGTALLMLAVFIVATAMPRLRNRALPLLAGTVFALAVHVTLQMVAPGVRLDTSHVTLVGLASVAATARAFWSDAYRFYLGPAVWMLVPFGLLSMWLLRREAVARAALLSVIAACVLYAVAMIVFFGGTGRHIAPALPLLLGAILVVLARPISLPGGRGGLLAAALTGVVLLQSGADWPQIGRRRLLARLADGHALQLYQEGVTVVTGDYWRAWPYSFALNMLHERGSGTRPVLTVAMRSEDLYVHRASQIRPGTKLAVVPMSDYRYWEALGPKVALSVVRFGPDYEVAIVMADPDPAGEQPDRTRPDHPR